MPTAGICIWKARRPTGTAEEQQPRLLPNAVHTDVYKRQAYAIAELITDADRSEENIIPGAFDPRVAEAVAAAVAKAARETGVARL